MMTLNRERLARSLAALDSYRLANVCPECGVGASFIHSDADGSLEVLCDLCTSFVPVGDPVPSRRERWDDLPPAVRVMRKSERLVYRVIRDLPGLLPKGIVEKLEQRTNEDAALSTVQHALCRLGRAGLIRRASNGWVACPEQKGGAR